MSPSARPARAATQGYVDREAGSAIAVREASRATEEHVDRATGLNLAENPAQTATEGYVDRAVALMGPGGVTEPPAGYDLFWDPRDADSLTIVDGTKISQWLDQVSGVALAQATDANRPLAGREINGEPVLDFVSTDRLTNGAVVLGSPSNGEDPATWFVLVEADVLGAATRTLVCGGAGTQQPLMLSATGNGLPYSYAGAFSFASTPPVVGTPTVISARMDFNSYMVYRDRAIGTGSGGGGNTDLGLKVGSLDASFPFDGAIGPIIRYPFPVAHADMPGVWDYFSDVWGTP